MPCPISHSLEAHLREGNGTPLQYSCLENPMEGGAWWAAVHGVEKSLTWLSDFPFTFRFHTLEKETATHSSVLAWRIPGMGEPGGLPSMGLHRVRHDWSDLAVAAAEAHLWAIAVASIRVHGGLLVSGLSCIVSLAFCPGLLSLQPLSKRLHMCTSEGYGIHNLKKRLANEGWEPWRNTFLHFCLRWKILGCIPYGFGRSPKTLRPNSHHDS